MAEGTGNGLGYREWPRVQGVAEGTVSGLGYREWPRVQGVA